MKKTLLLITSILIFVALSSFFLYRIAPTKDIRVGVSNYVLHKNTPYLIINNERIDLLIADNDVKKEIGLGNKKNIKENEGMLFIYSNKEVRYFWMKEMLFPLDIVWINDNKIIKIDKNLQPEGTVPEKRYSSSYPANYVLELNAGFCDANKINVGDNVRYFLSPIDNL